MDTLHAIILGIVEGFTEFLPISSTAHILLISDVLHIAQTEFAKTFAIVIQLGAILAVVAVYFKRLVTNIEAIKRVLVAFIPTAIVGFALYKIIKGFLFSHPSVSIIALILGGTVFILFERSYEPSTAVANEAAAAGDNTRILAGGISRMSYQTAFVIGLAQAFAVIPGVSRSGATIVAGLMLGIGRYTIVEFSFLLAIPTMIAASAYDLLKTGPSFTSSETHLLIIGFATAFIAAFFSIKYFIRYVSHHSFAAFGWYRIAFAVVVAILLFR